MSNRSLIISMVLLIVATSAQAQVHFRDFHNTTGLNLIGGTAVVGNKIRLVPAQRDSRGNFWTQKAFPVAHGFRAAFAFRYSHQGGSTDGNGHPGNDGLLFYIQPSSNTLQQNVEIPARSLLVFFDGYKNNDVADVSSSRVEVQVNAKRIGQTDVEPLGIRFREGKIVRARVEYDGHCLSVFLNDRPVAAYQDVNLESIDPGYVGFHGMGGDAYADVDVFNLHFDSLSGMFSEALVEPRVTAKYPLQLQPLVREVVWGGRWLADRLGRPGPEDKRLGESWEAFSRSVIVNGAWSGRTLGELFIAEGEDWFGSAAAGFSQFPLLAKFIDARENLSVQVHPNDALAQELEDYLLGKTEFWYILEAVPDAHIYYGLNAQDISRAELKSALANGRILRYLNRAPVKRGDVVFLPAGTVHAITAGIVVYELQQDSDITYRLYDWGRADREIHLERGLRAIDPDCANMRISQPRFEAHDGYEAAQLVSCAFFRSELRRISVAMPLLATQQSFTLLTVISGSGALSDPISAFPEQNVRTGSTLCIPAGLACELQTCQDQDSQQQTLEVILSQMNQV